MRWWVLAGTALAASFLQPALAREAPLERYAAANVRDGTITDLTQPIAAFADSTVDLADEARVAQFHARFDPILPGYFDKKGTGQANMDAAIARNLRAFPAERQRYFASAAGFRRAFKRGQMHFRQRFPDYRLTLPVYLLHSMGVQDGGTRTLDGKTILFFGADVIAKIHDESTIGPFLDHELFHAYHRQFFRDCDALWCSLWSEGMATYIASELNPGATDRQLLLSIPRPIAPEVQPRMAEAMCSVLTKFSSTDDDDYGSLFLGRVKPGPFPPRYGYYLGYLLAKSIGGTMSLNDLAKLPAARVEPLLRAAIERYGPCPTASRP